MKHQITGLLLCGAMALTSCSSMSDDSLVRTQAVSIGALTGAVGGAALGTGIAALTGNKKNLAAGAIIGAGAGAVIGAIAGGIWGESVVKEKHAYAEEMDYIRANIQELDGRAAQIDKCNATLQDTIARLKRTKSKLSPSVAASTKKDINKLIELTDKDIATARAAGNNAALSNKVASVTAKRNQLQSLAAKLDAVTEKV